MKSYTLINTGLSFIIVLSLLISGCHSKQKNSALDEKESNTLTQSEKDAGWKLLFDGKTFNGWRGLGRKIIPEYQWTIEDGTIRNIGRGKARPVANEKPLQGGDLITIETFENFELYFEWKLSKAGNSGIKYNVSEEMSMQYGSKYSALGFEFQLIDDDDPEYKGKLDSTQLSGSLYDMIPARHKTLEPVGKYNSSRILIIGDRVEHWLNGRKVVEFECGSQQLDSLYRKSKYRDYPDFHKKRKGHIVLQNHKDDAWFRNIKIRQTEQ